MSVEHARALRKRMTDAEMRLWFRLRQFRRDGLAFRRQSPVGRYVLDFECRAIKLAIEVDGGGHARPDQLMADDERRRWLEFRGYEVLRFWNDDVVFRTDSVVDAILLAAERRLKERL